MNFVSQENLNIEERIKKIIADKLKNNDFPNEINDVKTMEKLFDSDI